MGKRQRDGGDSEQRKRRGGAAVVPAPAADAASATAAAIAATVPIGRPLVSPKWTNRQRTLVFSSRGVSYRARHLMNDLRAMMPHSKKDAKMDRKDKLGETIPEICDLKNCNNCVYFEMRKKMDLYMWVAKMPNGPSAKFLVENISTLEELKLTGNCLKGSRPMLVFDAAFDAQPELQLLKELFFQTFGTPRAHPKSKAFVDHVLSFFPLDGRIWVRHYQIAYGDKKAGTEPALTEIGPRFALQPIRIFGGSFGGPTLYENATYVSPNEHRRAERLAASAKYKNRKVAQAEFELRHAAMVLPKDDVEDVFADAIADADRRAQARAAALARDSDDDDEEEDEEGESGDDDDDDEEEDEDDD